MTERSVPPSSHDLARARRAGDVPLSPLLVFGAVLLAAGATAPRSFESVRSVFAQGWRGVLSNLAPVDALHAAAGGAVRAMAIPLAAMALGAMVVTLAQTGGAWKRETPRVPAQHTGIGAVGVIAVLGAALAAVVAHRPDEVTDLRDAITHAGDALGMLVAAMIATGLVDLAVRRWQWTRSLHRTIPEARREAREDSGDPWRRAARRAAHRALLDETLPARDWHVITDGRASVVIAWREGMNAPRVVLQARGELHAALSTQGLPGAFQPELLARLSAVPVGDAVPAGLWEPVAAVIAGAREAAPRRSG